MGLGHDLYHQLKMEFFKKFPHLKSISSPFGTKLGDRFFMQILRNLYFCNFSKSLCTWKYLRTKVCALKVVKKTQIKMLHNCDIIWINNYKLLRCVVLWRLRFISDITILFIYQIILIFQFHFTVDIFWQPSSIY